MTTTRAVFLSILLACPPLRAQDITLGPDLALGMPIRGGSQLHFATDATKIYQIEISADLVHWDREGYAFKGTGGRMSTLVSNRNLPRAFYRLQDDAPPGNAAPYGPYGPYGLSAWTGGGPAGPAGPQGPAGPAAPMPNAFEISRGPILPRLMANILAPLQAGSQPPFRVKYLALGDSYALDLAGVLAAKVAPVREVGLGLAMGLGGGATIEYGKFGYSPTGTLWRLDGTGQTVQYGPGSPDFECYRVKVFYNTENGGGSFALETSTRGGPWTEVPGATSAAPVLTNNGGPVGAGVFAYNYPTTEPRRLRAKWVSGTARILGFVLSDIRDDLAVNRGGCAVYGLAQGGINVADGRLTPQAVYDVILRDLKPNFCTYKSDDGEHGEAFAEYYDKIQSAWPMDWVMVSRHPSNATAYDGLGPPSNAGRELLPVDKQLRDFAVSKGQLFVDGRSMFPDFASMIDLGLTTDGNAHLTVLGNNYQHQMLMGLLSSALQPPARLLGSDAASFETGARFRSTPLGITGKSGPGVLFDLWNTSNAGVNFAPLFAISKIDDKGTVGFHHGPASRLFGVIDPAGNLLLNNSFSGWQYGLPTAWNRVANGMFELHGGQNTGSNLLALSATGGHSGDVLSVYQNASGAAQGSRVAGVKADGAAEFGRLKASLPIYASHAAADADAGLLSGQFYKQSGNRAVFQKP